jgi:hypothetical protein
MALSKLTADERDVVRRAMEAIFLFLPSDEFHPRLGVTPDFMRSLLRSWSEIDDSDDDSDACLAVNNTMNDLLTGIGISEDDAKLFVGADRAEMLRIYIKWAKARGWSWTGLR